MKVHSIQIQILCNLKEVELSICRTLTTENQKFQFVNYQVF